jgi:hypothetical protein
MSQTENAIPGDRYADVIAGACARLFGAGSTDLCTACGHDAAMHPQSWGGLHRAYCLHCVMEAYLREVRTTRDEMLTMLDEFRVALTRFYEIMGVIDTPPDTAS